MTDPYADPHAGPLPDPPADDGGGNAWWRKGVGALAGLLAGGAFGYAAATAADRFGLIAPGGGDASGGPTRAWLGPLLGVALGGPLGVLAHELGHLAGGRLAGFAFRMLVVGPVKLRRTTGGVRLEAERKLALWGGLAVCVPTGGPVTPGRLALFFAGGPAASVLTGLALAAAAWATGELAPSGVPGALWLAAAVSGALACVTLLPMQAGGFQTDGRRLLNLLSGGPTAAREAAVWRVTAADALGARPRDLPADALATMLEPADGGVFAYVAQAVNRQAAEDRGDDAARRRFLDAEIALLPAVSPAVRPGTALAAAWYEAEVRRDGPAARRWLDRAPGGLTVTAPQRALVEAAVLLAEGDVPAARAALDAAGRTAGELPPGGSAAAFADAADRLRSRLR